MKQLSFVCPRYRVYWDGFYFTCVQALSGGTQQSSYSSQARRGLAICVHCWCLPSASGGPRWVVVQEIQIWAVLTSPPQLHWPLKDQLAPLVCLWEGVSRVEGKERGLQPET